MLFSNIVPLITEFTFLPSAQSDAVLADFRQTPAGEGGKVVLQLTDADDLVEPAWVSSMIRRMLDGW
jgi:hypothetical protein